MRRLLPSVGVGVIFCQLAWAQTTHDSGSMPQIPFGQTYKDFQFPVYQKGTLAYTFTAASATGVTINRADASDVKIDVYTGDKVTTTITSPRADIYVADRKMRTKNTVKIERADLDASSQVCDFDLSTRKFLLRQNVRVVLKNFDVGASPKKAPAPTPAPRVSGAASPPTPGLEDMDEPMAPAVRSGDSALDVPGASASTNAGPVNPNSK